MNMTAVRQSNDILVDELAAQFELSPRVEGALRAVDRAMYIEMDDEDGLVSPYTDIPWRNGNLHLSAPCIYCRVVEELDLRPGLSFLNLGSGTGYLSTVVGLLVGPHGANHGIEVHADVIDYANERLRKFKGDTHAVDKFDFSEPTFVQGNCLNLNPSTKYDRVYLGASCLPESADFFKSLVKPDGILIMPYQDHLMRFKRNGDAWDTKTLLGVVFTRMLGRDSDSYSDSRVIDMPAKQVRQLKELCRTSIRQHIRAKIDLAHPDLLHSDNMKARRARHAKWRKELEMIVEMAKDPYRSLTKSGNICVNMGERCNKRASGRSSDVMCQCRDIYQSKVKASNPAPKPKRKGRHKPNTSAGARVLTRSARRQMAGHGDAAGATGASSASRPRDDRGVQAGELPDLILSDDDDEHETDEDNAQENGGSSRRSNIRPGSASSSSTRRRNQEDHQDSSSSDESSSDNYDPFDLNVPLGPMLILRGHPPNGRRSRVPELYRALLPDLYPCEWSDDNHHMSPSEISDNDDFFHGGNTEDAWYRNIRFSFDPASLIFSSDGEDDDADEGSSNINEQQNHGREGTQSTDPPRRQGAPLDSACQPEVRAPLAVRLRSSIMRLGAGNRAEPSAAPRGHEPSPAEGEASQPRPRSYCCRRHRHHHQCGHGHHHHHHHHHHNHNHEHGHRPSRHGWCCLRHRRSRHQCQHLASRGSSDSGQSAPSNFAPLPDVTRQPSRSPSSSSSSIVSHGETDAAPATGGDPTSPAATEQNVQSSNLATASHRTSYRQQIASRLSRLRPVRRRSTWDRLAELDARRDRKRKRPLSSDSSGGSPGRRLSSMAARQNHESRAQDWQSRIREYRSERARLGERNLDAGASSSHQAGVSSSAPQRKTGWSLFKARLTGVCASTSSASSSAPNEVSPECTTRPISPSVPRPGNSGAIPVPQLRLRIRRRPRTFASLLVNAIASRFNGSSGGGSRDYSRVGQPAAHIDSTPGLPSSRPNRTPRFGRRLWIDPPGEVNLSGFADSVRFAMYERRLRRSLLKELVRKRSRRRRRAECTSYHLHMSASIRKLPLPKCLLNYLNYDR